MAAKVDSATCTVCETCFNTCPVNAIAMQDGVAVVNAGECIDCGACAGECPVEAISMD